MLHTLSDNERQRFFKQLRLLYDEVSVSNYEEDLLRDLWYGAMGPDFLIEERRYASEAYFVRFMQYFRQLLLELWHDGNWEEWGVRLGVV